MVEERAREELARQIQARAPHQSLHVLRCWCRECRNMHYDFVVFRLRQDAMFVLRDIVLQAAQDAQTQLGQMWAQQLERRLHRGLGFTDNLQYTEGVLREFFMCGVDVESI